MNSLFSRLPHHRIFVWLRTGSTALAVLLLVTAADMARGGADEPATTDLDYTIQLDVITDGFDEKTEWFSSRVGIIPPRTAVVVMIQGFLDGSDVGGAYYSARSNDLGRTWTLPAKQTALGPAPLYGGPYLWMPWDLVPVWHARTGKLLATGHSNRFLPDAKTPAFGKDSPVNYAVYSVYDEAAGQWSRVRFLELPDQELFHSCAGGAAQRYELPNGYILWPIYFTRESERTKTQAAWEADICSSVTVVRCRFDGRNLVYVEHGDVLDLATPRGLAEPSLTRFQDRYYLTLRHDQRGYVATSDDGLKYGPMTPWTFDDGQELGSYNTQQHWVTHSDGLFLVYTRRGGDNDHVIRHRAPLFMARVDPKRLCVLRATERILLPDRGAQFGNGGALDATVDESWVFDTEGMQGDAQNPYDIARTVRRGANNRVYLCRIIWNKPNRLVNR